MDETMKNATTEEIEEQEIVTDVPTEENTDKDPLKEAIEAQMAKIHRQGMLIGAQTICRVTLEKILLFKGKPGKPTMNDYKRLVKELQSFCETGLSRKVNADGETELVDEESVTEETVQN